ncbi:MAG: sigma-70 family RNA polymerase sigma factor [Gemmatimonadaceae bacterium]
MIERAERDRLAEEFEQARDHLRGVAYRLLGSPAEAEDAVQEAWFRLDRMESRGDAGDISNVPGWLATVVARVCLDVLRARRAKRERPLGGVSGTAVPEALVSRDDRFDPEREAALADEVGLALLVVLDRLTPAERVAFVLHDMFGLPFEEIAGVLERTPATTRQLASRARLRVRGVDAARAKTADPDRARRTMAAQAYLNASREGDFDALLAVLDPDVELRIDPAAVPAGAALAFRGAREVAGRALAFGGRAPFARLALVDGTPGVVVAPFGSLAIVLVLDIADGKIRRIEVVADPARLARMALAVLDA